MEKKEAVRRVEDLVVYQKATELFHAFLEHDAELLSQHYLGKELARQLVRSLDSICANIEEGYGRKAGKEFKQFLRTARGSARESYGRYARCRKFLPQETVRERRAKLDEILAMLFSLIGKLSD